MKTLLLDIDFTLAFENTPRPFLREFLLDMDKKYKIHFYTSGNMLRVTEFCRILLHQLEFDRDFVRNLQRCALSRENCPMVTHKKDNGSEIEIKSFIKASEILKVEVGDIIMLDDNPSYDHPNASQIIQAEGFMGDIEDNYLLRTGL